MPTQNSERLEPGRVPEELTAEEYSRIRELIGFQNTFCVLCGEIFPTWRNSTHYFICPFMEIVE